MPSEPTNTSPCSVGRMVPAYTLMYISHFTMAPLYPFDIKIRPMEAVVTPFPPEDITPPMTKLYRVCFFADLDIFFAISFALRPLAQSFFSRSRPRPVLHCSRPS